MLSLIQAIKLNYPLSFYRFTCRDRALSLRCFQLALWAISVIETPDPLQSRAGVHDGHSVVPSEAESELIDSAISLASFTQCLINSQQREQQAEPSPSSSLPDPLASTVGTLAPLGGSIGFLLVFFQFTSTMSKYSRVCFQMINTNIVHLILRVLAMFLDGKLSPSGVTPFEAQTFSPTSTVRRTIVEALLTLHQCLIAVR